MFIDLIVPLTIGVCEGCSNIQCEVNTMNTLKLMATDAVDHLVCPEEFNDIDIDSPALTIFTDFKKYPPSVIESSMPAVEAESLMSKFHVQLALVVDSSRELVGTINLSQLSDQHLIPLISKGNGRADILVSELMLVRADIKILQLKAIENASIADVVEVLRQHGEQHCLVVDDEKHHIRGLISISDIARRLHVPISIIKPLTFAEVFKVLKH
jgi:CBS domain-containing protein